MVIVQPATAGFAALSVPSGRDAARIEPDGGDHDPTINKQCTAEEMLILSPRMP